MLTVVLLGLVLLPATSGATVWCGDNGLFQFSFIEGDSLVTVLHLEKSAAEVTFVDIYCWLADIDPVVREGDVFLHVGGFELKLTISGAEAFILEQNFPSEILNQPPPVEISLKVRRKQRLGLLLTAFAVVGNAAEHQ